MDTDKEQPTQQKPSDGKTAEPEPRDIVFDDWAMI